MRGAADNGQLVSVIVPAFNAGATIAATLGSILAQSHARLEVLVVDDGSRDDTAAVVRALMADPRIELISQPNGGVAAARNRGLEAARGDMVAFCDADDLWAPTKLERQLRALAEQKPAAALCYSGFVTIDGQGRRAGGPLAALQDGDVLERLARRNFVGHASSMLMARTLARRLGGFDAGLRARGVQGCEDYDFLLRTAESGPFVAVRDDLVGYRVGVGGAMSSNVVTMLRSWVVVTAALASRRPDLRDAVMDGRAYYAAQLAVGALARGRLGIVAALFRAAKVEAYRVAGYVLAEAVNRLLIRSKRVLFRRGPRQHFLTRSCERGVDPREHRR